MPRFASIEVFDELPRDVEPCRDDRCPVIGLHASHKIWGPGRPPKSCPACGGVIQARDTLRFCRCGWSREVRAARTTKKKESRR